MSGDCEMCGEFGDYLRKAGSFWAHERCMEKEQAEWRWDE